MRGILLGAAVACVVSVDDFRGLAPAPKLAGQIVAAIPTAFGVDRPLHVPVPRRGRPAYQLGVPLTIVWIVAW